MKNAKQKERDIIVKIETLNLRNFRDKNSGNAIDAAFPVLAYECEVSVPVEKKTDAYEEAVLKFISIGLSDKSIGKTLNITESLRKHIFSSLEGRGYIEQFANSYKLTEKAENALNGIEADDTETESKFGYIFVSAIKKEPLWYFHEGDIFNIPRSDKGLTEKEKQITKKEKDENKSSEDFGIPDWRIEKAFSTYCRIVKMMENLEKKDKGARSEEKAADLFAGIELDLSEADYLEDDDTKDNTAEKPSITSKKFKVRKLKGDPQKLYLQIRIIFDPSIPGGYWVESPFDFKGNDNELFLRQIQWMSNQKDVFIGDERFSQFLNNEVNKLLPGRISEADSGVIITNKLPILNAEKYRYKKIYDDTSEAIRLMQQKNMPLLAKENITGSFSRKLIEPLMNQLFRTVLEESRKKTSERAFRDFTCKGDSQEKLKRQQDMTDKFAKNIKVDRDVLPSENKIFAAIKRLKHTFGNSIYEKLLNLIVFQFYQPSQQIRRFFQSDGIEEYIKTVERLNDIRNSASHAQDKSFTDADYEYYTNHVFDVANRLLEALSIKEDK
jgi:hypothetical protein